MAKAVIAGYSRSPFTIANKGDLVSVRPEDLLAEVKFSPNNFEIIKQGNHVVCAISKKKIPTIPSTINDELKSNIFLRSDNKEIKTNLGINNSTSLTTFSKLRDLKDNF